jgi:hypothetical protein
MPAHPQDVEERAVQQFQEEMMLEDCTAIMAEMVMTV